MKKILALALAVVFMFALAIPAFAATLAPTGTPNATDTLVPGEGQDVVVTYNVSGNYEVTIPSDINASEATTTATVSANKVLIKKGQKLTVSMSSDNDYELQYVGGGDSFKYSVTVGGVTLDETKTTVLVINEDGTNTTGTAENGAAFGSATLNFAFQSIKAKYQGQYKDTLTFTIAIS